MEEKIKKALEKPLYPYLYGLAFIILKSAQYFHSFEILSALAYFALFCSITYILSSGIKKTSVNSAGIMLVIVWASLFHFVNFAQKAGFHYPDIPGFFYVVFYLLVLAMLPVVNAFAYRIPWKYNAIRNKGANVFLLICCVVFITGGVFRNVDPKTSKHIRQIPVVAKINSQKNKDIVWILMDEYGSSASLKNQFNFNNSFDSSLAKSGFRILDSTRSRFTNTLLSLQSIFNLDDSILPVNIFEGVDLLKQGSLIPAIEAAGYRFINLGFFTINGHKPMQDRSGYPQTYSQQLFSGTLFHMLNNRYKYSVEKCDAYNKEVLQMLGDTLLSGGDPKFIWAHLSIPHAPYCRNSKGELLTGNGFGNDDSSFIKKSYIEYVKYGNGIILQLLKDHPELLGKIVIISGDHGPRFYFLKNRDYEACPFIAVNIPGQYDTAALKKLKYISQLPGFIFSWGKK